MNCSDISLILDDRDTGKLDDGLRKAADMHVAECRDCARDWRLHTRLVARKLPALPPDLLDECSALAVTGPAAPGTRRNWNRAALAVGIVVLVAAAATLTFYRAFGTGGDPPDRSVRNASSTSPSQDVLRAQTNTPSVVHNAVAAPTPSAGSDTFSVRVSTLRDDTLEAVDKTDFDVFRAAAIDELRRTPGLILVLAESSTSGQSVDFEITLTAVRRNGQVSDRLLVSRSGPNRMVMTLVGKIRGACAPSCQDAASLGESSGRMAAMLMMPPDAANEPALLKQLQDVSLTPQQRLEALRRLDLRSLKVGRGGLRTDPSGDLLRDPALIRAVIDLASVAPNPEQRAEIWKKMRSIKSPALVEPLANAAQRDPDSTVRTEAVATLVADYARDPRSRAALELIARIDSQSMVRALAKSGLSGEATWNSYVLSSLEDTTLPDAQRLEAILFHVRLSDPSDEPLAHLLDDDAIKALTQVLPRAASTGTDIYGVPTLLAQLVSVKHPAVTRMLLASVERRDSRFDRRLVMNILADRVEEPGVRAALEKIAKVDPDEQLRQIATRALQDE